MVKMVMYIRVLQLIKSIIVTLIIIITISNNNSFHVSNLESGLPERYSLENNL